MDYLIIVVLAGMAGIAYLFFTTRAKQQLAFIENYDFHPSIRRASRIIPQFGQNSSERTDRG
jgi:hypothetical protein